MRRHLAIAVALGLLATLLVATPASATHSRGKWAPAIRVYARTNDDGRAGSADATDVGDISLGYDRWGYRSSDDPIAPGMDSERIRGDVARCQASRIDAQTVRMRIDNVYPGYTCSFVLVTVNKAGVKLVVDDIDIRVDPTLEFVELDAPVEGDVLKSRRRLYGSYAVTVLQEAPQGETLEFDIKISFTYQRWRRPPPRCCHHCWR